MECVRRSSAPFVIDVLDVAPYVYTELQAAGEKKKKKKKFFLSFPFSQTVVQLLLNV